jgi:hypothetical protein
MSHRKIASAVLVFTWSASVIVMAQTSAQPLIIRFRRRQRKGKNDSRRIVDVAITHPRIFHQEKQKLSCVRCEYGRC